MYDMLIFVEFLHASNTEQQLHSQFVVTIPNCILKSCNNVKSWSYISGLRNNCIHAIKTHVAHNDVKQQSYVIIQLLNFQHSF